MKAGLTVLSVVLLVYLLLGSRHPARPPGIAVPGEPSQIPSGERNWEKKGYKVTALARFQLEALVISAEPYWFSPGADLSPLDLALGWGPLSDQSVVDNLSFSQGGRWFRYRPRKELGLTEDLVSSHSANMHMIPADSRIEKILKSVEARDLVNIRGYLVEVNGPNGSKWRSSLTRTDTGSGSCELVWVEEVSRRP